IKRHFAAAAAEIGLATAPGRGTVGEEGVGPYRITTRRGLRCSAADAFLRPALRRRNLALRTGAAVERIDFEGRRAAGVTYRRGRSVCRVRARRGVLLAAGAIKSPQLLQLSGIGPGARLAEHGIEVLHANPAVGGGLQDHLGVDYLFRATEPTLNQSLGTLMGRLRAALAFLWSRSGPLSLSVNQMGGMVRSSPERARADMQLYFNPLSYTSQPRGRRVLLRPDPWPGFAIGFNACRPTSRGRVDIATADPAAAPEIAPNYLSTNEDVAEIVTGGRLIERMLGTDALRVLVAGPNGFGPGGASDEALIADFRARATSVFHACGTCRMAPEAEGGVVDHRLRVHGVEGLRVVDASIFPNITSANTNAPTLMVAEMAATQILAD
ncbi:MAG: GMC oxidoreductase, partial [Pseudomonadota bacterium]